MEFMLDVSSFRYGSISKIPVVLYDASVMIIACGSVKVEDGIEASVVRENREMRNWSNGANHIEGSLCGSRPAGIVRDGQLYVEITGIRKAMRRLFAIGRLTIAKGPGIGLNFPVRIP